MRAVSSEFARKGELVQPRDVPPFGVARRGPVAKAQDEGPPEGLKLVAQMLTTIYKR
jgi:hypothetical protein